MGKQYCFDNGKRYWTNISLMGKNSVHDKQLEYDKPIYLQFVARMVLFVLKKMKRQLTILILVWSALMGVWAFASPPSGTIGTTFGAFSGNGMGNIGIRTASPATALDVNGAVIIRKSLDMTNNRIMNVIAPATSMDAINKAYADAQTSNMVSSTIKLWGEGRPGVSVLNAAGECTNTISDITLKVSRSSNTASWDGARAACPTNWWVCSASERGSQTCGATTKQVIVCNPVPVDEELYEITANWGWVSDTATTNDRKAKAARIVSGANTVEQYACNRAPVWCCSY